MGLQKHEKQAVAAMIEAATEYGVDARPGEIRNNKHPTSVVFEYQGNRVTISVPSSPRDKTWCVRVAGKKAKAVCRDLASGLKPVPFQHV
ncbi:MAG: hypothetical protein DI537_45290 [Stutzerimonas stutzeri]|nr:MAG: hypothetical protein DI537_45290 [Stutzerimonas stutzeri]